MLYLCTRKVKQAHYRHFPLQSPPKLLVSCFPIALTNLGGTLRSYRLRSTFGRRVKPLEASW